MIDASADPSPAPGDGLPAQLAEIVEDFHALGERDRLQLLLEFSQQLPDLPERYAAHRDALEPVPECQSPIFLAVEVDPARRVHLFFEAPAEAPTTRGFASILREGLDGLDAQVVLDVPDDVPARLGLTRAVSPLRLRGMAGMLSRIKRRVREQTMPEQTMPEQTQQAEQTMPEQAEREQAR